MCTAWCELIFMWPVISHLFACFSVVQVTQYNTQFNYFWECNVRSVIVSWNNHHNRNMWKTIPTTLRLTTQVVRHTMLSPIGYPSPHLESTVQSAQKTQSSDPQSSNRPWDVYVQNGGIWCPKPSQRPSRSLQPVAVYRYHWEISFVSACCLIWWVLMWCVVCCCLFCYEYPQLLSPPTSTHN